MKAIEYKKYGSPNVLEINEVDLPTPKSNEVLIKNYAPSVNSFDWDLLRGKPAFYRLLFGLFKAFSRVAFISEERLKDLSFVPNKGIK